jgi:glycyl-tRNA synthetase beta chain
LLFKRAKNITKDVRGGRDWQLIKATVREPAELALVKEIEHRSPIILEALTQERYSDALNQVAKLYAPVDKFFVDVLVMAEDAVLRRARLDLVASVRDTISNIADIAEIAPEEVRQF